MKSINADRWKKIEKSKEEETLKEHE